jgi:hypothetical protein
VSRHGKLRWWHAAVASGAILALSGCALLLPVGRLVGSEQVGAPTRSSAPVATAVYHSGTADVQLSGGTNEQLRLRLVAGSSQTPGAGVELYFRDDNGWGLTLIGFDPAQSTLTAVGQLGIDRAIRGHWEAQDDGRDCVVTLDAVDPAGTRGSATCKGLRWADALGGPTFSGGYGSYIRSEKPFDATITFQALPMAPAPSPAPSDAFAIIVVNEQCLTLDDAADMFVEAGLTIGTVSPTDHSGAWLVKEQYPPAGAEVPEGTEVELWVGPPDQPCP